MSAAAALLGLDVPLILARRNEAARKLERYSIPEPNTGCMLWLGAVSAKYGQIRLGKHRFQAHRVAYVVAHGSIPDGLVMDHLCRNTLCVRPDHLEPVTGAENVRRGFGPSAVARRTNHCKRGHELVGWNVIRAGNGGRNCRTCHYTIHVKNYLRRKAERDAAEVSP